eukprot:365391-Chlamydomonas_euryale.AAC.18
MKATEEEPAVGTCVSSCRPPSQSPLAALSAPLQARPCGAPRRAPAHWGALVSHCRHHRQRRSRG